LKLPICTFDAKTGILCPKCDSRLQSGNITKSDVEVSIQMSKLQEKIPELEKTTLIQAIEVEGDLVLLMGNGDHDITRKNLQTIRKMERGLHRKIWISEAAASDRELLEEIFFPIKILTVNVVWLPDGSRLTKVIIPGRKTERFPVDLEQVKRVVKAVRGIDLLVEFERS
jgi:transcription antitermination factor NusA-like protein